MNAEMTAQETATIKGVCEAVFKRAGGRGEMGPCGTKNILKGELGFDASRFTAGNVEAGDDETVKVAKAYAVAIAAGHNKLSDLNAWPQVQKMVETMLKPSLPPMPVAPSLPPMPAMPASHSVKPVKGKRAA
jgi:hypothetical protein